MKHIETNILIQAPPARAWTVLTNFEHYAKWNPFIRSISGEKKAGGKLTVSIQLPRGKGMTFTPDVLAIEENMSFAGKVSWVSKASSTGYIIPRGKRGDRFAIKYLQSWDMKNCKVPFMR